jgi:baseplate J-like protein
MPITLPKIDDRRYQDLLDEALARIPLHTAEWTNFNRSDPGVTLIEVFAFLTESLLYRANQIPKRTRAKFFQLLQLPLQTATPARGLVAFTDSPSTSAVVLPSDLELRSGQIPFRTTRALAVLPIEGRIYTKKTIANPDPETMQYYQQLYLSYRGTEATVTPSLYQATPFPTQSNDPVALADAIDGAFWLALLVRENDAKGGITTDLIADKIAKQVLSLGIVPSLSASSATLPAGRRFGSGSSVTLRVDAPDVPASGGLPDDPTQRIAKYKPVAVRASNDVFAEPGVIDITLPSKEEMKLWENLEPLEAGVDALPPALDDPALEARLITWLRITPSVSTTTRFTWMGINSVPVTQLAHVANELLPEGNGEPDQIARLAHAPVLSCSVTLTVITPQGERTEWTEIDDLSAAGPEVPVPDPRRAPGSAPLPESSPLVFLLNAEAGELRFGDGMHGRRPPEGATLRASYDYAEGTAGNVGAGTINAAPSRSGFKITNPIATWGGADAESVEEGEKHIARSLQHHERLVTANDFLAITARTPGVDIARIEVLPNFHPDFGASEVAGVVTLMLIPTYDPDQPDAPLPRAPFLDAVCRWLDPRRLLTTEIFLRGPDYQGVWISVGVKVAAGFSEAEVTKNVEQALRTFLAPSNGTRETLPATAPVTPCSSSTNANGWKLGKSVVDLELIAVANRVEGVELVQQQLVLAKSDGTLAPRIDLTGLQLPRILGIRVTNGLAVSLDELRGTASTTGTGTGSGTLTPSVVQIPIIPEECR